MFHRVGGERTFVHRPLHLVAIGTHHAVGVAAHFGEICDLTAAIHCEEPGGPGMRFVLQAAAAAGVSLK